MQNQFLPSLLSDNTLFRLGMAALFGAVIGLERDIHGRTAGLRTHLLVSLGSALFMLLSVAVAGLADTGSGFRADPGRIAAQIVTGIGFIGAGAIIKEGFSIRGLTTAASLWVSAAIGMAAACGFIEIALLVTFVSLMALIFLHRLERSIPHESYRVLTVRVPLETGISTVVDTVKRDTVKVLQYDCDRNRGGGTMTLKLSLRLHHRGSTDKLASGILGDLEKSIPGIDKIRWARQ